MGHPWVDGRRFLGSKRTFDADRIFLVEHTVVGISLT